jgi:hypothetical protein
MDAMESTEAKGKRFEPEPVWIKSSRSAALNACVELAVEGDCILLRDSKAPETHQRYSRLEIDAFMHAVRRGEFEHLLGGPRWRPLYLRCRRLLQPAVTVLSMAIIVLWMAR